MSNLFKRTSETIKKSPMVIPLFLVFVVMFIVAIGVNIEDYSTSRLGYMEIPTRKANDWVIWLVALIPQVGQIGFSYLFAADTNKRWAAITAFSLHFVDVATDMVYKAFPYTPISVISAFIESEVIYTLGSEIMLVTSFGMVVALFPDFICELGNLMTKIFQALSPNEEGD